MTVTVESLPKSQVELHIELSPDELQPYLVKAAAALSREQPLKGFRPGNVPLNIARQRYGDQAIWSEAADQAIRDGYVRAVREHDVKSIGHPQIQVQMLAPDNPVKFTATVSVLPKVDLADPTSITVQRVPIRVTDADVTKALIDLQKLQPNEALVDRPSEAPDTVVVDMDLTLDHVPVEGGQARDHRISLNEGYELPRVREELLGVSNGTVKSFPLEIPREHPQQQIAGKTLDCAVTVKGVYAVTYPDVDDAFAQRLGLPSADALRTRIRENLELEATQRAEAAEERALLSALVNQSAIADLPELLITSEAHRMVDELERGVIARGMTFDHYLESLKKTRDDLLLGFAPEAVQRVKVALVTRAVAAAHAGVASVGDAEVDAEIAEQLNHYQHDEGFAERIHSEEARDYVHGLLRNRKVIQWLRGQVQWREPDPVSAS